MVKIVGVRFRNAGKVYYFDPKNYKIKPGDHVIVETARGVEYGTVTGKVQDMPEEKVVAPLKPVLRVANGEDEAKAARNREREREAMAICKEKIRKHNLDMKLIDAEYTFDNNKVLFYFTADGRIDFRELVKDLAAVFRTRIELRQIGVRDETKILGGVGICGRPLCCSTFLSEFAPVSIRMAKDQNLSLNPTKISGVCGRLMCCLKNEEETYEYLNSKLPAVGDMVTTSTGLQGEVSSVNVLRQRVKVLVDVDDEKELQEYDVEELKFRPRRRKEKGGEKPGKAEKAGKKGKDREQGDRDGEQDRNRDREQNRDREGREKGREKDQDRERNRDRDQNRDREGREKGREKDQDRERNRDRGQNKDRGGRERNREKKRLSRSGADPEDLKDLRETEGLEELEILEELEVLEALELQEEPSGLEDN